METAIINERAIPRIILKPASSPLSSSHTSIKMRAQSAMRVPDAVGPICVMRVVCQSRVEVDGLQLPMPVPIPATATGVDATVLLMHFKTSAASGLSPLRVGNLD